MNYPTNLKYTKSHEWIEDLGGGAFKVGLSDYAQHALGDIVFVNLPEAGVSLEAGQSFCDVESVKAVSDVYSPVGGTVTEVNEELLDAPEKINQNCYEAWLVKTDGGEPSSDWMDADAYAAYVDSIEKGEKVH